MQYKGCILTKIKNCAKFAEKSMKLVKTPYVPYTKT